MNIIIDALSAIKNIRLQDGLDIAIIAAMIFLAKVQNPVEVLSSMGARKRSLFE